MPQLLQITLQYGEPVLFRGFGSEAAISNEISMAKLVSSLS